MPTLLLRLTPGGRGWGLDHLSCRSRHSAWIAPIAVIVCTSGPTDGHRGFPGKRCDRLIETNEIKSPPGNYLFVVPLKSTREIRCSNTRAFGREG